MNDYITLYGFGYVGRAVFNFLKDHFKLAIYDPAGLNGFELKPPHLFFQEFKEIKPTKLAILCVPTEVRDDGSCDTNIVEEVINKSNHEHYLVKSTVVPGTVARIAKETGKQITFSPEYIGEGNYSVPHWMGYPHPTDMKLHQFHIFGGEPKTTEVWMKVWQKVAGWAPKYAQTDSTTAEIVKYAENSYLATQKMFFDQLFDIAEAHGSNYNTVRELLLLDERVSPAVSIIYPEKRGFDGKCLPKDVAGVVRHMEKLGHDPHFFRSVLASNKRFRKKEK